MKVIGAGSTSTAEHARIYLSAHTLDTLDVQMFHNRLNGE